MSASRRHPPFNAFNDCTRPAWRPGASCERERVGGADGADEDPVPPSAVIAPGGERLQARSALRARVAVLFLATAVASCGGGGDGSSAPLPPPPPPALIPAVTSVPEPVGYPAAKLAAFHRLNELRAQAGLGLLAQNTSLDAAAQAHADWEVSNDLYTHIETVGSPLFSGEYPMQRDAAFGYSLGGFNDEVLAADFSPEAAVDGLVQVVYHRQALLSHQLVDVGIGWSDSRIPSFGQPLVIDAATPGFLPQGYGQAARIPDAAIVWPSDGATGVFCLMGGEYPNPLPMRDVYSLGTPVSVEFEYWKTLQISEFTLTDMSTGQAVNAELLTASSDVNKQIRSNFAALLPVAALSHNTTYAVHLVGTVDGTVIRKDWMFMTGQLDAPPPI